MAFTLPDLPYSYDALEPYIDARTMEIHHSKHHRAYVDKVNAALEGTKWVEKPIEEVIADISRVPEDIRTAVRNNGGGVLNHNMFWTVIGPPSALRPVRPGHPGGLRSAQASSGQVNRVGEPSGELAKAITETFGDFQAFKGKFTETAATQFGSGWTWLTVASGQLSVVSTSNQDSPLTEGLIPILTIDVWEHAYYLKYQNRRPEYIESWWQVVNWEEVARRYAEALR